MSAGGYRVGRTRGAYRMSWGVCVDEEVRPSFLFPHTHLGTSECLSTPTAARSRISTSRSRPAPAPLPPPPCSISDDLIACGDGSGSGATYPVFKRCRSAHIMRRLPAAHVVRPAFHSVLEVGAEALCGPAA